MGFNSISMFFVCVFLLCLAMNFPLFSINDSPSRELDHRSYPIDGLRGILALSVFFHHGTFIRIKNLTGKWENESHFYDMIGSAGVAMFFMITGYLFWLKIIRSGGKPSWVQLYVGRVFRIAPLYLFVVSVVFVVVAFRSNFELREPISKLILEIGSWLGLGVFSIEDINNLDQTNLIVAGVFWSLQYEWTFYMSLVLLALLVRFNVFTFQLIFISLIFCLISSKIFAQSLVLFSL